MYPEYIEVSRSTSPKRLEFEVLNSGDNTANPRMCYLPYVSKTTPGHDFRARMYVHPYTKAVNSFVHTPAPPRPATHTYGRPVCDAGDATFRTCFAHVSRCFARFTQGITHVSRMFRACFAMFRGISQDSLMIRGFAMIRDVSHMFRARFARFAQGITHVSRMFRACFEGVKHGECASHTGRP